MKNERLQRLIKESGLTYEKAAEMVGSKFTTISGWVNGGNLENSTKFYDLCKLMGWNPEYIINGTGDKSLLVVQETKVNYGKNLTEIELLKLLLKEKDEKIEMLKESVAILKEKCRECKDQDKNSTKSKAS